MFKIIWIDFDECFAFSFMNCMYNSLIDSQHTFCASKRYAGSFLACFVVCIHVCGHWNHISKVNKAADALLFVKDMLWTDEVYEFELPTINRWVLFIHALVFIHTICNLPERYGTCSRIWKMHSKVAACQISVLPRCVFIYLFFSNISFLVISCLAVPYDHALHAPDPMDRRVVVIWLSQVWI